MMDTLINPLTAASGLLELFLLPGSLILERLAELAPKLYAALAHDNGYPTSTAALGAAALAWLVAVLLAFVVARKLQRLGSAIWYGVAYRLEGLRVWLVCRLKTRSYGKTSGVTVNEEFHLGDIDIAVLEEGASLPAGYTLSVVDLATRLQRRPSEVQKSLDILHRHQLVNPTLGSSDGYGTYSLTDSGAWYMAIHRQREVTRQTA